MAILAQVGPTTVMMDMLDTFPLIKEATHITRQITETRGQRTGDRHGDTRPFEVRYVMTFDGSPDVAVTINASEPLAFDVFEYIVGLRSQLGTATTQGD